MRSKACVKEKVFGGLMYGRCANRRRNMVFKIHGFGIFSVEAVTGSRLLLSSFHVMADYHECSLLLPQSYL